jgi:hypothetical protein
VALVEAARGHPIGGCQSWSGKHAGGGGEARRRQTNRAVPGEDDTDRDHPVPGPSKGGTPGERGLPSRTMFLRTYNPGPPLGACIDRFWLCSDTPPHPRERILPSGTVELVINLSDDEIRIYEPTDPARPRRYSGAAVSGPYRDCFLIDPLQHASIIGVHFRPGGAFPFLGVPASAVADTHVDLDGLWGSKAVAELRERLCEAAAPGTRFAVLEEVLLGRLRQLPPRHGAIPVALDAFEEAGAAVKVRDLARQVGLS